MTGALTPDELGSVGEDLFQKLCSQGQLHCNPSTRDRTGWDFRVEFPMERTGAATLDQRLPRVCMVQVKATAGESGTRVAARLSAADRLAKDASPAFIVIFRMKADGTELMGYLIHLIDAELGRVLRRVRQAQADGRMDINHMTISFDYRKGRRFKPTAAGLKEAFDALCPLDASAYGDLKRHQLAHLGYEEGGLEADLLIWIEDKDHYIKLLSGLAPLKPLQMNAYDRRFGIRLPYKGTLLDGIDEFPIQLPAVGPCDIIVRGGPRLPAALFQCEAFAPPPMPDAPLLSIRHPLLTALFKHEGLEIQTTGTFQTDRHGLEDWILLLRALSYLATGTATLELEFRGIRLAPLTVPPSGLDGPYHEELPDLLALVERWQKALSFAGVAGAASFTLDDMMEANGVRMSLDMLFNPTPVARLEVDVIEGAEGEQTLAALYFNSMEFAGTGLTFALRVTLERQAPDSVTFASSAFELMDIRPGIVDLDAYGAEIATENQIQILINPRNMIVTDPADDGEPRDDR